MEYSELIRDYLDDSAECLLAFDSMLTAFEKGQSDKELVIAALGALHTMKGNSGMMGYNGLKDYIHLLEEVLKKFLEGKMAHEAALPPLLEGANVLRRTLQEIEKSPSSPPDLAGETLKLRGVIEGKNGQEQKQALFDLNSYMGTRTDTIKVSFHKLDDLLSLVGELVIFKTRLTSMETGLKESGGNLMASELKQVLESAGKTISGLQEGIMKARMIPVSSLFRKFTRMAKDLARSQGKQIEIVFQGEQTELDKTVIDELADPLLHLIRNAIDHGLEDPAEREQAGKLPEGRLTLSSAQESNYVIVRIEDNGRGIDPEKIRQKAVQKKLIREDASLAESDILNLIFLPGFSTKDESSDVSGRGIGLDIVNKNITRLNGHVRLESKKGEGSAFIIKLPLSLAIISALMAEVSGETFAIPISAVEESVKVDEKEIHVVNQREVINLRENVVPVLRLNTFFNLKDEKEDRKKYLVVVGKGEKTIALAVDRLKGQQEIVIKPLDETFGRSEGVAGASILGDGRIVLILDVLSLWENGIPALV